MLWRGRTQSPTSDAITTFTKWATMAIGRHFQIRGDMVVCNLSVLIVLSGSREAVQREDGLGSGRVHRRSGAGAVGRGHQHSQRTQPRGEILLKKARQCIYINGWNLWSNYNSGSFSFMKKRRNLSPFFWRSLVYYDDKIFCFYGRGGERDFC